jgi:polyisoprenoid-binding protein YceI
MSKLIKKSKITALLCILFFLNSCNLHTEAKQTSWVLNKESSSISITSTKNNSISEVFDFNEFAGKISSTGYLEISITLNSLETNIPIRNERIQEHLFETSLYPTADIHTQLKPSDLKDGVHTISFDVDLHGVSSIVTADFLVVNQNENKIISLHKPLIIQANMFNLESGITALKNIASLQSIATTVPMNIVLTFSAK